MPLTRVVMDERAAPAAAGAEALGQHRNDRREILARQRRDTARRGGSARTARPRPSPVRRPRRRSAAPARRAAAPGSSSRSSSPRRTLSSSAAHSTSSSRDSGNSRPLGVPSTAWPERPTRCRKLAIERGEPSWQTRSTSPMSMPSSSEAVATSAFSSPCLSRCSASSRCSLARLPWCAVTCSSPSRSESWRVTRSAMRRVLTKISVVRCSSTSSARRSIDLLPHLVRHHRLERRVGDLEREIARATMAGVDDPGISAAARLRRRPGNARRPRSASAWPRGRCAADGRRTARPAARATAPDGCRACSAPARGSRRRSPCGWSPASCGRTPSRAGRRAIPASSRRYAAAGGACARARPRACRRCAPRCGSRRRAGPARRSASRMPASGASRLRWMSFDSALSGET